MIFNSVAFGIFFPVAVIVYFLIPSDKKRTRLIWLLLTSYYFYICQSAAYALILLFTTLMTYGAAFKLKGRKSLLAASLTVNLAILFFFKYFGFFCETLSIDPGFRILLPVGISFYIFKSSAYLIDVYRGDTEPERDFLRYALFVSFFPELLAGPISRAPEILPQFDEVHTFDYKRIRDGLFRMLWGYFLKIVIAARLAILVDLVFDNYDTADSIQLIIALLVYGIQVYCDFMSYTEIAIGAGQVLGIKLRENFRQPFLAGSLSDLWRRWHMSLMSWFRDYLYFPLGGSRKGLVRKYINILIVFTLSGLWHGAAFTYILWGFFSGLLQVIGEITSKARARVLHALPVHNAFTSKIYFIYSRVMTYILFTFTVIFFRSPDIPTAMVVARKVFTEVTPEAIRNFDITKLGLGTLNLSIAIFAVLVLFTADIIKEKLKKPVVPVTEQAWYVRWPVYIFLTVMILLSTNIGAARFIYFEF